MKWLLLLVLLMPMLALGQGNTITRTGAIAPPSGAGQCAFIQFYVNSSNADLYDCQVSTWVKVGSAGGGGITNSAPANHLMLSDGTNAVDSSVVKSSSDYTFPGSVAAGGSNGGADLTEGDGSGLTAASGHDLLYGNSITHKLNANLNNGGVVVVLTTGTQYSKGSCTEVWGGSGTSFALTSGDDAIANNSCYNDSGVTRTITAVKCRNDNASNTTTVNPTFGAAGTGTTILSGALTCGNSYAYSATGTVSNAAWTTGTGITPAMSGTLTGTSIAMIVEYTF